MAFKKLSAIIGECESLDDVAELFRAIAQGVLPEGVADATEKAAELGAKIANDVEHHQFLKHALVSEYNKAIAEAFPDQVEEKKQECSQECKHKDKHKG